MSASKSPIPRSCPARSDLRAVRIDQGAAQHESMVKVVAPFVPDDAVVDGAVVERRLRAANQVGDTVPLPIRRLQERSVSRLRPSSPMVTVSSGTPGLVPRGRRVVNTRGWPPHGSLGIFRLDGEGARAAIHDRDVPGQRAALVGAEQPSAGTETTALAVLSKVCGPKEAAPRSQCSVKAMAGVVVRVRFAARTKRTSACRGDVPSVRSPCWRCFGLLEVGTILPSARADRPPAHAAAVVRHLRHTGLLVEARVVPIVVQPVVT